MNVYKVTKRTAGNVHAGYSYHTSKAEAIKQQRINNAQSFKDELED